MEKTIIFLSKFYTIEYGVAHFIRHISLGLNGLGWNVVIFADHVGGLEQSDAIKVIDISTLNSSVIKEIQRMRPDIVCAHTSPYFEILPEIEKFAPTFAFEHGDPTPELFTNDYKDRFKIIEHKKNSVYPKISGVATVSNFIREEIEVRKAKVIYAGGDHVLRNLYELNYKKDYNLESTAPLKIVSMYRLGKAEALYKSSIFIEKILKIPNIELTIIGRGTESDKQVYERMGARVYNQVSDHQRNEILLNSDCYLSTSLWEGYNSPLVEAQFLGTPGLAFDVGAHPETTPHLLKSFADFERYVNKWRLFPESLAQDGHMSRRYVSNRFLWRNTTLELHNYMIEILDENTSRDKNVMGSLVINSKKLRFAVNFRRAIHFFKMYGLKRTVKRVIFELSKAK